MATKRLGKGINALIRPPSKQATSPAGVTNLPISKIKTNPHQPRKKFDKKSLVELAMLMNLLQKIILGIIYCQNMLIFIKIFYHNFLIIPFNKFF